MRTLRSNCKCKISDILNHPLIWKKRLDLVIFFSFLLHRSIRSAIEKLPQARIEIDSLRCQILNYFTEEEISDGCKFFHLSKCSKICNFGWKFTHSFFSIAREQIEFILQILDLHGCVCDVTRAQFTAIINKKVPVSTLFRQSNSHKFVRWADSASLSFSRSQQKMAWNYC